MAILNRRSFVKAAGAAATLPLLGSKAFAQEKLKVGFIFLGPIGDFGWTWAHNKGREAIDAALGDKVETLYTENVAEDASAIPAIRDLANAGCKLIFTTSYGYMDQTVQVASEFPDVKFEHCTGFKRADNVSTYNSKFHEGRAVLGTIAGMMSKSGKLGYLGSYKVPEVVLGVNSFTLAAQKKNPNATVNLVLIDSWYDPPKEAAATETMVNLGDDIITTHTDSPGFRLKPRPPLTPAPRAQAATAIGGGSSTGTDPRSLSPSMGKISVDRTAAHTSDDAVDARMCPVSRASVVIASTSGSCVDVNNASDSRSRRSRTSP